jgi:hypothetical protein
MAKQHTESRGAHRKSPNNNRSAAQSHDRQDREKNPADRGYDESADESVEAGGGEESKHGRKHKGNVDDT